MKEYSTWNENLRVKLYYDGKVVGTIDITFDDYNRSYKVKHVHGKYYDYYEGIDKYGDIDYYYDYNDGMDRDGDIEH